MTAHFMEVKTRITCAMTSSLPQETTVSTREKEQRTSNKSPRRPQFRRTVQAAVVQTIAFISALVTAGSNSETLSNGANLTVIIDQPGDQHRVRGAAGRSQIDVPVTGSASIGLGEANATFIYVIDTSGSTGGGGARAVRRF